MASSEVFICNLALQRLGQPAITTLAENSVAARECNRAYEHARDTVLSSHNWGFAHGQKVLAPDAEAPDFDYLYAFTWPADCLRPRPPNTTALDWKMSSRKVLTNDGDTLNLDYTKKVTDTTLFADTFTEALSIRLALQMCEKLTQSNTKKADLKEDYKLAIAEAKRLNDIQENSADPPEDTWLTAMR